MPRVIVISDCYGNCNDIFYSVLRFHWSKRSLRPAHQEVSASEN